jgi:hypothetical protein
VDFKTISGKEYKNATVSRVEPDGIVVRFSGGIVKTPFTDVSDELRRKYNYDRDAAKQFAAEVQRKVIENQRIARQPSPISAQPSDPRDHSVDLSYYPPEELIAKAHKTAREKMLSPEEEKTELSKIPVGGALGVSLHAHRYWNGEYQMADVYHQQFCGRCTRAKERRPVRAFTGTRISVDGT